MKKILYISMVLPFKKVPHAGGQTFYHYIKAVHDEPDFDVTLIAKVLPGEKFDMADFSLMHFCPVKNRELSFRHPLQSVKDIHSKVNPFSRFGNVLRKSIYEQILDILNEIKKEPDVVVLEFAEMVLLAPEIRKRFPKVRIIASEHDVSYLGFYRKYQNENNIIKKALKMIKYRIRKKYELMSLNLCNSVMPHNFKDKELLVRDGIAPSKIYTLTPYFHTISCKRNPDYRTILYYGAMGRNANVDAAVWVIREVLPKLENRDIRFVVLGAKPQARLLKYASKNVIITGFVDDISPYFESCICMVVPLKDGAGIKVKVLEAMAAGIPVLTNHVGIEGISARDGDEYIHCETASEYCDAICRILDREIDICVMSNKEVNLIKGKYDLYRAMETYKKNLVGADNE